MTFTQRVLSLFVAFVLFGTMASGIASANSAADNAIFEDNFDSYPVGVFPSSGGWNLKYSGYGASYQIVDNSQSVSSPNSLKLEGRSGWAACADRPLPETPDQVIFEVDVNVVKPGSSTGWVNSYVSLVDPNVGWGRAYGLVGFGANMLVGPGEVPYNLNQWYHVKVKIDIVDRIYDVWLDGELIGENLPLPADGTYKCVRLSGDNCGHTRVLFDNVLVTEVEDIIPVEAEINFDPDTLNLGSGGKWVTVYIELPDGYDVSGIDASGVFLNGVVPAVSDPQYEFVTNKSEYLKDTDGDGILERMLKFDREEVEAILGAGDEVIITFEGKVGYENEIDSGMAVFEGMDTITVIESSNVRENNGKKGNLWSNTSISG
ncbi:hypothetical protein [Methanosarcina sp. MTP4]|uniref:hypothetical protein n=1 Tax=Methanosarcina sp. MTP4 TaxID=1434100 RepID=UPI000A6FFED2|nr:hypothetical protein [Methanosarcina sp. MTP4]